jgi:hypothetical protein
MLLGSGQFDGGEAGGKTGGDVLLLLSSKHVRTESASSSPVGVVTGDDVV